MDYPSASELFHAFGTLAWGPTIDPASMVKAGGPNTLTDESFLQAAMKTPHKVGGYAEQYEAWAEKHPILSTGADLGVQFAMSEIPWTKAFKAMGGGKIADIIDLYEKATSSSPIMKADQEDPFEALPGGSAANKPVVRGLEANPSRDWYRLDRPYDITEEGDPGITHMIDIYHKGVKSEPFGSIIGHLDETGKNMHISDVVDEDGFHNQQLFEHALNLKENLIEFYPNLETISTTKKSGATKFYELDVTDDERGYGYPMGISREMEQQMADWYDHVNVWRDITAPTDVQYYLSMGGNTKEVVDAMHEAMKSTETSSPADQASHE